MARRRKVLVAAPVTALVAALSLFFLAGSAPAVTPPVDVPGILAGILGVDKDPGQAERGFLELINAERAAAGLGLLTLDTQLSNVARDHSGRMAGEGTIFHNLDLGTIVTGAWKLLGENVGMGGTVAGLHNAFMASPKHKENVLGTYDRAGLGVVIEGTTIYVTEVFWLSKTAGAVAGIPAAPAKPAVVNAAPKAGGTGYWMVRSDGEVLTSGDAAGYGSLAGLPLARPIVGIAATPTGKGYWLVASDGGVFSFGDARFFGSTGNIRLAKPIVGMTATPKGKGYWMVASDGGIFSFGDAKFFGSTGNIRLAKPIVGMTSTPGGSGYWMVASDGGIFSFGDAKFLGSGAGSGSGSPTVAIVRHPTGAGYWLVAADGRALLQGQAA